MTENEFHGLFGDDLSEIQDAMDAAEAEVNAAKAAEVAAKPKKDGLWYVEDGANGDGHSISWYALNSRGKTVLWFSVDNDLEVSTAPLGNVPAGITGHAIRAHNAQRTASIATNGIALKAPHPDGTGNHVDGQSVRCFAIPRVARWIAEFYGV